MPKLFPLFIKIYIYFYVYTCTLHMCRSPKRPEEGVRTLGTELQVAVSHLATWLFVIELWSSGSAGKAPNCWAGSPTPKLLPSFVTSLSGCMGRLCGPTSCSAKAHFSSEVWQGRGKSHMFFCYSVAERQHRTQTLKGETWNHGWSLYLLGNLPVSVY